MTTLFTMASTSKDVTNPPVEDADLQQKLNEHYKKALERYEEGRDTDSEYDSDEERMQIAQLQPDEIERYEELKDNHIRQLVEYGRIMPISAEIKRHMFKWLPGLPTEYIQRARDAVYKKRQVEAE